MSFAVRAVPGTASSRGCFASQTLQPFTLLLTACPLVTAPCFTLDRRFPTRCCICWKTIPRKFKCKVCKMEAHCEGCLPSNHHSITCRYLEKLYALRNNINDDVITFSHLCINLLVLQSEHHLSLEPLYDLCQLPIDQLPSEQSDDLHTCIQLINQIIPTHLVDNRESLVQEIFLREICNGFCFWDESYEKYAQAIVPSASYFNHSCYPNAFKMNIDGKVLVYSLREIAPNEEIVFSYVPHDYDLPTRQRILSTYFGFTCTCLRCQPSEDLEIYQREELKEFEMNNVHHGCGGVYYSSAEVQGFLCSICHSVKN